jgi:hypothetical protein
MRVYAISTPRDELCRDQANDGDARSDDDASRRARGTEATASRGRALIASRVSTAGTVLRSRHGATHAVLSR